MFGLLIVYCSKRFLLSPSPPQTKLPRPPGKVYFYFWRDIWVCEVKVLKPSPLLQIMIRSWLCVVHMCSICINPDMPVMSTLQNHWVPLFAGCLIWEGLMLAVLAPRHQHSAHYGFCLPILACRVKCLCWNTDSSSHQGVGLNNLTICWICCQTLMFVLFLFEIMHLIYI